MRISLGRVPAYGLAYCALLFSAAGCLAGAQQVDKTPKKEKSKTDVTPIPVAPDLDLKKEDLSKVAGAAVDPRSYVIGPEDIIAIRVWREQEMSALYVVRPDGKISMPLVGEIEAGGSTPKQLEAKVVTALETVMNRPQVAVSVQDVRSKKYYVQGQVNRAGSFPLVSKLTVLEALGLAGGLQEFANEKDIRIIRKGQVIKFNYKEVTRGKKMEQNIELLPGDQIIVR
ncbi:MAG: polysaccharide biosynthesis/export family protein [Bryobacteraceae bacterium]|nr:polysaccharide biosynthesis/export family protein [Bryobacteraceae bacterium]